MALPTASSYVPAQQYAQNRLRDVPRYAVPPPNLQYNHGGSITLTMNKAEPLNEETFGNPTFLRALAARGDVRFQHNGSDWEYEQRRTAQPIMPFLFLGPGAAAQSIDFVRHNGITLLVAVRSASAARLQAKLLDPSRFKSAEGIQTMTLDLENSYDMITNLPKAIRAINNHIEQCGLPPAKVLVFCESGNDRSATMVCAYLMVLYGLGAVEAMQVAQSQRFCISIDDSGRNMLQNFEDLLVAKRMVANSVIANQDQKLGRVEGNKVASSKRGYDNYSEDYDDLDEDMEDGQPEGILRGSGGRAGLAPFHDREG